MDANAGWTVWVRRSGGAWLPCGQADSPTAALALAVRALAEAARPRREDRR